MANRVTADDVKVIIDIDENISDARIVIFIKSANILTNNVNTIGGLTDADLLMEIERWLSAHLVAILDVRSASEKADEVSQKFQYKVDLGFNQTQYGQQALALDTTGYLAGLQEDSQNGGSIVASLDVLGTSTNP